MINFNSLAQINSKDASYPAALSNLNSQYIQNNPGTVNTRGWLHLTEQIGVIRFNQPQEGEYNLESVY